MLANPKLPAYMYDPYNKVLTVESYDHTAMRANRKRAIEAARPAQRFGIILGETSMHIYVIFTALLYESNCLSIRLTFQLRNFLMTSGTA